MSNQESRLITTEIQFKYVIEELKEVKERLSVTEKRLKYYDDIRLRWGGILIGAIGLSAGVPMFYDTLKEKILHALLH